MLECPICGNQTYDEDEYFCEECGFDGIIWDEYDYLDFFDFDLVDDGFGDLWGEEYEVSAINDEDCDLPATFIMPEEYLDGIVTQISERLFLGDKRLKSVIIPRTTEIIGAKAFYNCINLDSLTILGCTYISSQAFENCYRLKNLLLPEGLELIGYQAFSCCKSLQTLVIPKSVRKLGHFAFQKCSKLTKVIILNPEIEIENTAFHECPNIVDITIPFTLAEKADSLFKDAEKNKSISWIEQTDCADIERSFNISLAQIESATYTNDKSGKTAYFKIENNNNCSANIDVFGIYLIANNEVKYSTCWLSGYQVDDKKMLPGETIETAAIFYSDLFSDKLFDSNALIGIRVFINNGTRKSITIEEILEAYRKDGFGDYSEIYSLPFVYSYTAVFRNYGNCWRLIATNIPEKNYDNDVLEIEFANFVIRTNTFNCNQNHEVETIEAVVNILADDGTVFKASTIAGYCRQCNCYFLLEKDFRSLQQKGKLLCQLLSWEEYRKKGHAIFNGEDMKAESVLKRCGYNVNASDNLSSVQRQKILSLVLENGLYTETELCSFLDWLINYHGRSKTRDMSSAIKKWSEDRTFVQSHNWDQRRRIGIRSISK